MWILSLQAKKKLAEKNKIKLSILLFSDFVFSFSSKKLFSFDCMWSAKNTKAQSNHRSISYMITT